MKPSFSQFKIFIHLPTQLFLSSICRCGQPASLATEKFPSLKHLPKPIFLVSPRVWNFVIQERIPGECISAASCKSNLPIVHAFEGNDQTGRLIFSIKYSYWGLRPPLASAANHSNLHISLQNYFQIWGRLLIWLEGMSTNNAWLQSLMF